MANIKISELDELQEVADQDLFVIVDSDENTTKKIQAGNLNIKGGDTLPIGAMVEYNGTTVPAGYEKVSDGNFSNIYSTSEQIVGKDENGKNVYKRTFSGITSDTSNSTTITTDYSGKTIVVKSAYGSIYNPAFGGGVTVGGYVNENFYCGLYLHETELQIYYGNACKNFNYNITIEFTKVSD